MNDTKVVLFIVWIISAIGMIYCANKDKYDETDVGLCGGIFVAAFMFFLYT